MGVYRYYASEAQVKFLTTMRDRLVLDGVSLPAGAQIESFELLSQAQASRLITTLKDLLMQSNRAGVKL